MPKAPTNSRPLSCLFAINKPTGQVSMQLLNKLQPLLASSVLFRDPNADQQQQGKGNRKRGKGKKRVGSVKMGQGGTLDPLADGVLVIGTNNATKHLARFLDCTKEYRAIGFLGCSTDSYDSEGKRVKVTSTAGIDAKKIEDVLAQFRGEIDQTPPTFSALKMDGKALYEYARGGIPLPRPIPSRKVTVHSLTLSSFTEADAHSYEYPKEELGVNEKVELEKFTEMAKLGLVVVPKAKREEDEKPKVPEGEIVRGPIFEISMTVSSGTYVRSIVHDIGIALGSSAYVVKLTRTRQGEFSLNTSPFVDEETTVPSTATETTASEPLPPPTETIKPEEEAVATTSSTTIDAEAPVSAEIIEPGSEMKSEEVPTIEVPAEPSPSEPTPTPAVIKEEEAAKAEVPAPSSIPETFAGGCIEWETIEKALSELKDGEQREESDEMLPWEVELLRKCKMV